MLICPRCNRSYSDEVGACTVDGTRLRRDISSTHCTVDLKRPPPEWPEVSPGAPPVPRELSDGRMVGEYRIDHKLGEGGFGKVYRATHPLIGKSVAIKVLSSQLASSREAVSRFVAEARAVNQIRHRNIVDIFSFGVLDDGQHYFVMELLEGLTLREELRRNGRLSPARAIEILRPLARALDAAHAAGIAHRDLKPDNIFLVTEPEGAVFPKLIDFGIAKLLDEEPSKSENRTRPGAALGTPKYMSPEQCRGGAVDHRTDLYSLGVVVHEMLTGERPFESDGVLDVFVQHTSALPPKVSTVSRDLPEVLDGPVLHMLAKNPEERPVSVGAAIEALAAAVGAPSPSGAEPTPRASTLDASTLDASSGAPRVPAQPTSSSRTGMGALIFGALFAALALAVGVRRFAPVPAASTDLIGPIRHALPVMSQGDTARQGPIGSPAPEPQVTLEIRSIPPVVDVYLGNEKLGTSEAPVRLRRSDTKIKLTAKSVGYAATDVEVTPNANGFVSVTLLRATVPFVKKKTKPVPPELESPFGH